MKRGKPQEQSKNQSILASHSNMSYKRMSSCEYVTNVTHTHTKTSWGSNKQLPGVLHRVFVSILPEKDFVPG